MNLIFNHLLNLSNICHLSASCFPHVILRWLWRFLQILVLHTHQTRPRLFDVSVWSSRSRGGESPKYASVALTCPAKIHKTCSVDGNVEGHHEHPPTLQTAPSQEESDLGDSSRPLFSMYSKIAEEEDNKMTDRWQQEATDGVLVFVSTHVRDSCNYSHKLERCSPVYSLLPLLRCSPFPFRISSQILKTSPHSISRTSIRSLQIKPALHHPGLFLPLLPYQPCSLLQTTPSG
jgi:hypothetical protein